MDVFTVAERSAVMRSVRSKGTKPEMVVRSIVRRLGVRYRSCAAHLPGKPDIIIGGERKAILVHGCFWHGHHCEAGKLPQSNRLYWRAKQLRNAVRDSKNAKELRSKGWKVIMIWECEVRSLTRLEIRIRRFLKPQS